MKAVIALCLAVALSGLGCSDDAVTTLEQDITPLELDMLPLAQGTVWTYAVFLNESYTRNAPSGNRITIERKYGRMELSVTDETPGGFLRTWQVRSVLDIDSVRIEDFLDYKLQSIQKLENPNSYTTTYSILYERDTLWYSDGGELLYMMPGHFAPGGDVNLKIFNFPGTSLLLQPLPYSYQWASGHMIYLLVDSGNQQSAKIGWYEGVVGIGAITREQVGAYANDLLERELHFDLISRTTTALAPTPGRN